jgi:hypothetical protein
VSAPPVSGVAGWGALGLALVGCAGDPASLWKSRHDARSYECARVGTVEAARLEPGTVPEASPRASTFTDDDAMLCRRRYLGPGERAPRDEAVLSTLREQVGVITQAAAAGASAELTWVVDAYYPDPRVAAKIAVATRTELAERRLRVSDRVPVLAAGDVAVLRRVEPHGAYPLACARFFAERTLGPDDRLLGVMLLDTRATELHAGLCERGVWRWLR